MAYQLTCTELDSLPWATNGRALIAHLPDVTIIRPFKGAPYYTVVRNADGDSCCYSTLRFGVGEPQQQALSSHPVVYEDKFEAETQIMSKFMKFQQTPITDYPFLGTIASQAISLSKDDQKAMDTALLHLCTNQTFEAGSSSLNQAINHIVDTLAVTDLEPSRKQSDGANQPTGLAPNPVEFETLDSFNEPPSHLNSGDSTFLLQSDESICSDETPKTRKTFLQFFKKQ
jgi:hypothetical protein